MPKNSEFLEKKAVKLPQRPPPNSRWPPAAGDSAPGPRVATPTYWYRFVEARF